MRSGAAFLLHALLVLAESALAQVPVVLPDASLAVSHGNTNNNIPFSWRPTRYQQLFDGADAGGPNLFLFLQLRPAAGHGLPGRGGQMVLLEIRLGCTPLAWNGASSSFAQNNPNPTLVLGPRWVQMPHFRPESPADWQVTIPFDQPWPWPGQQHLCVEVVNWGNTNGNASFTYPLDAISGGSLARTCRVYASGDPMASNGTGPGVGVGLIMRLGPQLTAGEGWFATHGQGCKSSAGEMISGLRQVPRLGSTLDAMLYGAPAGAGALFLLGPSSGRWGPLLLPFDLSQIGAPGCWLHASGLVVLPAAVGGGGQGTLPLVVPTQGALLGAALDSQWLVVDPPLNALGLAASEGGRIVLGR